MIYRHPNSDLENFTDYLYSAIHKISNECKLCTLLGDYNLNLLNFESHKPTGDFINTLASYFFQPHIIKPTRITNHSATLIDNIFFNSIEHDVISGNFLYDLTDHLPNFLVINDFPCLITQSNIYKRDYSNLDGESFVTEVQSTNWDELFAGANDINSIFGFLIIKINVIVDKHAPFKKLTKRESKFETKPWITKGIKISIAKKNKLYKDSLRYKNEYFSFKFKYYRTTYTRY